MAEITADDGCRLYFQLEGAADRPLLVFSNSLGVTQGMWDAQAAALQSRFRLLRYDTRGHGASGTGADPYRVDRLGRDVLALLDHLKVEKARFCGLSMGGLTGMWLGRHAAHRFERIALCNTAALIGTRELWDGRIAQVMKSGLASIADGIVERWFSDAFRAANPKEVARVKTLLGAASDKGYAAACAAIRDADLRADLKSIALPTLVIAGRFDQSTPPDQGRSVAAEIPGSRFVELKAAHLSNIEAAAEFTRTLGDFMA